MADRWRLVISSLFRAKSAQYSHAAKSLTKKQLSRRGVPYLHNQKENFSKTINSLSLINEIRKETKKRVKDTNAKIKTLWLKSVSNNSKTSKELREITDGAIDLKEFKNRMNKGMKTTSDINLNPFIQKYIKDKDIETRQKELQSIVDMFGKAQALNNVKGSNSQGYLNAAKKISDIAKKKDVSEKELYSNSILRMGVILEPVLAAFMQEQVKDIFKAIEKTTVTTSAIGSQGRLADIEQSISVHARGTVDIGTDVKLSKNYTNQRIYDLFSEDTENKIFNYLAMNMIMINNIWGHTNYGYINTEINRYLNATFLYYNLLEGTKKIDNEDNTIFLATPYGVILKSEFYEDIIKRLTLIEESRTPVFKSFGTTSKDYQKTGLGMSQKDFWRIHDRKYKLGDRQNIEQGYSQIFSNSEIFSRFSGISNALSQVKFQFRLSIKIPMP